MDHAWSWFALHAAQRLQMLNFWLVAVAFLTAAYVAALKDARPAVASGVAVAGAVLSLCFHRLERRTRQLVRLGEAPLKLLQEQLATQTGIAELQILVAADRDTGRFSSYGDVIRAMQWLIIAAFVVAAVLAPSLSSDDTSRQAPSKPATVRSATTTTLRRTATTRP